MLDHIQILATAKNVYGANLIKAQARIQRLLVENKRLRKHNENLRIAVRNFLLNPVSISDYGDEIAFAYTDREKLLELIKE